MDRVDRRLLQPAQLFIKNGNEIELHYYEERAIGSFKTSYYANIKDEIFKMLEADLSTIARSRKKLASIYKEILNGNDKDSLYRLFFVEAKRIANEIKKFSRPIAAIIICSIQRIEELKNDFKIESLNEVWYEIETVIYMQFKFKQNLTHLSSIQLSNKNRKVVPMFDEDLNLEIETVYEYRNEKQREYIKIHSIIDYYNIIFYYYIISNPMIAQCKCCDGYFTPLTKRITLYCDRVNNKGVSCKVTGARLTHALKIKSDAVIDFYTKEKHRIEMYCNRSKLDSYDFFCDYYDWLEMFEPKFEAYKAGKYNGDQLIKEIKEQTLNFQAYSKCRNYAKEEGY